MRSLADLYNDEPSPFPPQLLLPNRKATLQNLRERPTVDVVVAGSGLTSAAISYMSALSGLRTLWLLSEDLDSARGPAVYPLRAPGNLKARVSALKNLTQLCEQGRSLCRIVGVQSEGLGRKEFASWRLATLLIRMKQLIFKSAASFTFPSTAYLSVHLDLTRITREFLVAARQEGAQVVNYAAQTRKTMSGATVAVSFKDSSDDYTVLCGAFVDTRSDAATATAQAEYVDECSVKLIDGVIRVVSRGILGDLEGIDKVCELLSRFSEGKAPRPEVASRLLPGLWNIDAATARFVQRSRELGVSDPLIQRVSASWGSRVRYLDIFDNGYDLLDGEIFRGEVELALRTELLLKSQDLVERRLVGVRGGPELERAFAQLLAKVHA